MEGNKASFPYLLTQVFFGLDVKITLGHLVLDVVGVGAEVTAVVVVTGMFIDFFICHLNSPFLEISG